MAIPSPAPKKTTAQPKPATRVALIELNNDEATLLAECFKQFNVNTIIVNDETKKHLTKEKLEGCVVRLDDNAEPILEAARNSPSNRRMLIYGITDASQNAMRYSRFGINAIFRAPLERAATLKVVRATYLLALHEYRRYVRIPVAMEVMIDADGRRVTGLSEEISSGGMSVQVPDFLHGKTSARALFTLPNGKDVSIKSLICWRRDGDKMMGIRFDAEDQQRQLVREWIDEFLNF